MRLPRQQSVQFNTQESFNDLIDGRPQLCPDQKSRRVRAPMRESARRRHQFEPETSGLSTTSPITWVPAKLKFTPRPQTHDITVGLGVEGIEHMDIDFTKLPELKQVW